MCWQNTIVCDTGFALTKHCYKYLYVCVQSILQVAVSPRRIVPQCRGDIVIERIGKAYSFICIILGHVPCDQSSNEAINCNKLL